MTMSVKFKPSLAKSFQTPKARFSAKGLSGTRMPAGGLSQESSSQDLSVVLRFMYGAGFGFSNVLKSKLCWISAMKIGFRKLHLDLNNHQTGFFFGLRSFKYRLGCVLKIYIYFFMQKIKNRTVRNKVNIVS